MRPTAKVLEAFGANEVLQEMAGGHASVWRSGGVILKHADLAPSELGWLAHATPRETHPVRLRLGLPRSARDGRYRVDGWISYPYLVGAPAVDDWGRLAAAAEDFAALFGGTERPAFLDERDHAWARADRIAWGEENPPAAWKDPRLVALLAARRPVSGTATIVHGDLTGNVLFEEGLAPAVIDPTIYWRPVASSIAIIAVDAISFHRAPASLLRTISDDPDFAQYAVRALIFRIATDLLNQLPQVGGYDGAAAATLQIVDYSGGNAIR
jgi:hypothetical protein